MDAIRATWHDLKLVKTRGQAQLIFEVPIERAQEALDLLGIPQPAHEIEVGIARLKAEATKQQPPEPKPSRSWYEMKPSQRAGILCEDMRFARWANEFEGAGILLEPNDAGEWPCDLAAKWLRERLGIESRSQLNTAPQDGPYLNAFLQIESRFRQWAGLEASPEPQEISGSRDFKEPPQRSGSEASPPLPGSPRTSHRAGQLGKPPRDASVPRQGEESADAEQQQVPPEGSTISTHAPSAPTPPDAEPEGADTAQQPSALETLKSEMDKCRTTGEMTAWLKKNKGRLNAMRGTRVFVDVERHYRERMARMGRAA